MGTKLPKGYAAVENGRSEALTFIANHDYTIVQVQIDSTKLVHAGLLCIKSVSAP